MSLLANPATRIGLAMAAGYAATYFWRYPIFMLPPDILDEHVVTIFDHTLDLQDCFSMSFIAGFGFGKWPALRVVTSEYFFRRRLHVIIGLCVASMLIECVGVLVFAAVPALQVLCVFCSSFLSSFLFGAMITYLVPRARIELAASCSSACCLLTRRL
jgi:hypothetical protein